MNVNLTPKLEEMVKDKVATGLYNNASEVVREALRLMEARDRHEVLREEAQKGVVQLREGRSSPLDMKAAKKVAEQNAKRGRKVNPLVTP
ncbi:antitoxin ParD1/3/4 [Caballeronia udeis]|uniref:Antitoxin ParD1/3/4 n=1 Tax=Caballeronia udeis TaxID=1232866 RepID=A0ABW8MNF3_9BURK